MIWVYDNAIVKDLEQSFNTGNTGTPVVKVISPENIIGIAAQIKNDDVTFPIVALNRDPNTPIDDTRYNFTRAQFGVPAGIDTETNILYSERAIPIDLKYEMTILTTNTADMDEMIKELIFKYTGQYFLTAELPYESKRKIRFAIEIPAGSNIEKSSASSEYSSSGTLYQSIIQLHCKGCVLISYTGRHLNRYELDTTIGIKNPQP